MKIAAPPSAPYNPYLKQIWVNCDSVGNAPFGVGATMTFAGTGTPTSVVDANNKLFINYASAAVLNSNAGWDHSGTKVVTFPCLQRLYWQFRTGPAGGDISSVRIWVAVASLASGDLCGVGDDPTDFGVGFRFSTSFPDTNWKCWANNNTAGGTFIDSGVAVAANTEYRFAVDLSTAGTAIYTINGAVVATTSSKVPSTTQAATLYMKGRTLSAAAINVRNGRCYAESL